MTIKSRLRIFFIAFIFFTFTFFVLWHSVNRYLSQLKQNQEVTDSIVQKIFELNLFMDDYLFLPTERARTQWKITYNSLGDILRKKDFYESGDTILLNSILEGYQTIGNLFSALSSVDENDSARRTANQLLIKSRTVVSSSKKLAERTEAMISDIQFFFNLLILIIVIVISMYIAVFILWIHRRVLAPLIEVNRATQIVASGNLGYKIKAKSKDEIGQLVKSFNSMVIKLKKSYRNLEEKIDERTKDLKKFVLAVENATDHIVITDTDGVILYANKSMEQITGFSRAEVMGKKAGSSELWGGLMDKKFYHNMWDTLKNKKLPFSGEVKNKRKNGQEYYAYLSVSPVLNKDGQIEYFVELQHDTSKEKVIDTAKTEFVSLVSHQLRTPLAAVSWYTEMLLDGDAGTVNERQKKYLGRIYSGNKWMIELINSVLNISRLEMGIFSVEFKRENVEKIAKTAIAEFQNQMKEKKINFSFHIDKGIPFIRTEKRLLYIIFQNLISNAIKYTPMGGTLDIHLKGDILNSKTQIGGQKQSFPNGVTSNKVSISEARDKGGIIVQVSDSGCGISLKQQDKIFEKFFRADNVLETTEGTGLGLYVVKLMVEKIGGRIWFSSVENKGTSFYVIIPNMKESFDDKSPVS